MKKVKITELVLNEKTHKNIDNKKHSSLIKTIKKYGQIYPIIIDNDNNIVKGRHLFKCLQKCGIEEVWVNVVDCNQKQLYAELITTENDINPIELFKTFRDIDLEDNCIPYHRDELSDFIKLLEWHKDNKSKMTLF